MPFDFLLWSQAFIRGFGYLGLFIVNFVGSASIMFPLPSFATVFTMGAVLDPLLVALFSALGAAGGEMIGYMLGFGIGKGIRRLVSKRAEKNDVKSKQLKTKIQIFLQTRRWIKKYGAFMTIIIFAATPLPTDVIGLLSGAFKYDYKKFFLAVFVGKLILYLILAYSGFYGIHWVLNYFGG
ncbi:MAG: hypothetical protein DRO96_01910 [Candidatus Aenigmatarchaeota archaeon]|nr:MAG: hypothetical protein DRO96_01910 [Candidatus Aenigmarchaeota archaeon]